MSLGSLIINTVRKVKNQVHQDRLRDKKIKLEHYQKPITPPYFYQSIPERDKYVRDGVYSTKGIIESLNEDVTPAGYSLEQFSNVGFKKEVETYESRKNNRIKENHNQLKYALDKMLKALNSNIPELTERDRNTLLLAGILTDEKKKEVITLIKKWIKQIDEDKVNEVMLDQILKYVDLKLNIINDALGVEAQKDSVKAIIEKAQQTAVNNALTIVNRSLNFKRNTNIKS